MNAQVNFSIRVNFQSISSSRHVYVAQNDEKKFDTLLYPVNSILEYKGQISKPGTFQILLDSSSPIRIWVDKDPISFDCKEIETGRKYTRLTISNLEGSIDTRLLYQMTLPGSVLYPSFSSGLSEKDIDSIKKTRRYAYSYNLVDSIFLAYPQSSILPFYLRYHCNILGPEVTGEFYRKLPDFIQTGEAGLAIKEFLDRSSLLEKGTSIENFSLKDQRGNMISLQGISTKFILLDFWASWCGPCRAENPALLKLYNLYKVKGLEILGVSLDRDKEDWIKAIEKDNLSWLHISDLKGWDNEIAQKYKISSVPFMVLLDSSRKVIALPASVAELEEILKGLIK